MKATYIKPYIQVFTLEALSLLTSSNFGDTMNMKIFLDEESSEEEL